MFTAQGFIGAERIHLAWLFCLNDREDPRADAYQSGLTFRRNYEIGSLRDNYCFVTGHDFSRAGKASRKHGASAPAKVFRLRSAGGIARHLIFSSGLDTKRASAGAKAHVLMMESIGTTEVVPCYKARQDGLIEGFYPQKN